MRRPSLLKEQLSQGSRDRATIPKELGSQLLHHLWDRLAIIYVAWRQTTRQQVATVVNCQMQFEAVKPAHAGLATPSINRKDAMVTDPFGVAHFQGSRVDEADTCTSSHLESASRPAEE